jgi:hypothetical protein
MKIYYLDPDRALSELTRLPNPEAGITSLGYLLHAIKVGAIGDAHGPGIYIVVDVIDDAIMGNWFQVDRVVDEWKVRRACSS